MKASNRELIDDRQLGYVPEIANLPDVDTNSEEYALGFDAGTEGKPCDGETREWRRGVGGLAAYAPLTMIYVLTAKVYRDQKRL